MDLVTFFSISLFFILLVKWILTRKKLFSTFERLGIPGPKPSFLFGNLPLLAKPYFDVDFMRKYGPIYGFFIGAKPMLAVTDPELLKIVQVKESQKFHVRAVPVPEAGVPSRLMHLSIPLSSGQRWKENRDSFTQAYTTSKFKMMNGIINRLVDGTVLKIAEDAAKGDTTDLGKAYSPLFLNAFFEVALGIKFNSKEAEDLQIFVDSIDRGVRPTLGDPLSQLSVCFPELAAFLNWFNYFRESVRKALKFSSLNNLLKLCESAITARIAEKDSSYADVLQFLINGLRKEKERSSKIKDAKEYNKDHHMKGEDLSANTLFISLASYELLMSVTTYGTYELAKSPRVQEKLRKEILEINGTETHISYENLSKMQYLDQVFNEVLRLYPTAPFFTNRVASEDYYYKGLLIPKGTTIYIPQLGLLRSESNFPDPDTFIPERFEDKSKINPYVYQPFGIGPRHCAGMRLSQYFGKLTLARVVQSFNLSLDPSTEEITPVFHIVVNRPKGPVRVRALPT